ncbi:DUF6678 family protein [Ralstonia mannitolilytica]|uniref:DUF6678 family protein n=3 Tax=Ralstonia TaxID=48736 RepID=UPI003BA3A241
MPTMVPLMNDTKWNELRIGMYELGAMAPRFRVRNIRTGYVGMWDGEWFYHFQGRHEEDEWVEVAVTSEAQRDAVLQALRAVRVPGVVTEFGFRIFGYVPLGTEVDYL